MNSSVHPPEASKTIPNWTMYAVWGVVTMAALLFESTRWWTLEDRAERLTGWICGRSADWLPFLPWLFCAPFFWWGFRSSPRKAQETGQVPWLTRGASNSNGDLLTWIAAAIVFTVALSVSWRVGATFDGTPPAYHDEYSYLFQARTYLSGRLSFPSFEPMPELFDQMHVLNEGMFASRYFPGTGFWMAPFVFFGVPWLGHQVAHGLAAMLLFLSGRELSNNGVGLLAGLLFAVSPGMVLFSNLLLAHHPTLLGLTLFLWSFLRWMRTGGNVLAVIAGTGLAFAMLCRPMTAAGFGLPFGIYFLWWWIASRTTSQPGSTTPVDSAPSTWKERTFTALCLSGPLLAGGACVLFCNWRITGSAWTTPYQLYTDIYTPRHVYGFNNVLRGEQHLGPKVLENYDRWAENLTPTLAAHNVGQRLVNSLRWSLGLVPLSMAGLLVLLSPNVGNKRWWLICLAILSLHAVHVPYWFEGIMGWHYVLETAPLWILLFAEATRRLLVTWRTSQRRGMVWWWAGLMAITLGINLVTVRPLWPGLLERGMAEIAYPRQKYAEFRRGIEELRGDEPAIVFVIPDPADRHFDYVSNPPSLTGPVLVARLKAPEQLERAAQLFSERKVLVFDAANNQFRSFPKHR